ncbi:MAG: hypothetical protein A2W94_01440 [Bacteroidetes bacterium GWE2_42_42]|nr:MAG: hypothetical protein A2W94_01440 [Bacteroidetes bacterium GWE2_42_42]
MQTQLQAVRPIDFSLINRDAIFTDQNEKSDPMKSYVVSVIAFSVFLAIAINPLATYGQATVLISQGGTVSVNDGDMFYDAGGAAGNDGNTGYTITLMPAVSGESVCVDFTSFITYMDFYGLVDADRLEIYDGLNTSAPNIGSLQGNYGTAYNASGTPYNTGQPVVGTIAAELKPGIFCANNASGALTFRFVNNSSSQYAGWVGVIKTYQNSSPGCAVSISANPASICSGSSTTLTIDGHVASAALSNNFNTSTVGTGWSSSPGTLSFMSVLACQPNNGYDTRNSDLSVFAWMQNVAAPRTLETAAFDLSSGGTISFDFRMASDDNGSNGCEAADSREGVYLQYSTNNGSTWTTCKLMFPGELGGGILGCGNYVYNWNKTTVPIPAVAMTSSTKFRWTQQQSTSGSEDSWGIDNVQITARHPFTISVTNETAGGAVVGTSTTAPFTLLVSPTVTTVYKATITDGTTTCTSNVTVTVNNCASTSCGTCALPTCPIGLQPDYPSAEANHTSYCNVPSPAIAGPQTYVTYHSVTVNSSGILGVVASSYNGGVAGCAATRTFKLYPVGSSCLAASAILPSVANANGSIYSNPEWTGLTPGNYILEITHSIAAGCGLYDNCQAYYSPACTPVVPAFTLPASICTGSVAPTLPVTSNNNIFGTWSPASVSNTTSGTYIFTPDAAQCAGDVSYTINVSAGTPPTYTSTTGNVTCAGPNSGSITINPVSSGTTFEWVSGPVVSPVPAGNLPSGASDERALINLPVGTYCVDITNTSSSTTTQTLFSENFESGISNWTINNSIGSNIWVRNNNYTGGTCVVSSIPYSVPSIPNQPAAVTNSPNSYYLHIQATNTNPVVCGSGSSSPFPPLNANFNGSDLAANQTALINNTFNTTGLSNVNVNFYWMGDGDANDYCILEYSLNGGSSWTQSGLKLNNQTTWIAGSRTDATWANQTNLKFRFRWVNNNSTGQDPPICLDQISITAEQTSSCSSTVQECFTISAPSSVTPTFSQLGPYCAGATPATLATTATNGITGTWSPAAISTASAGSTVFTFTPAIGQCATTATMTVVVNANAAPTFTQLGPYCVGATPGTLPTTSVNGISGTWNAAISTASAGSTLYTFTPAAGQCATTATMTIVVNANVTPTFSQLGPYCAGATSGILATTSTNGITGTWSPATISTASAGSTVYTFNPNAGQCATTATMTVVVNANAAPTFTQLGPYCVGATPGTLPTTSVNGISGTWNAAISTASAGSTLYTFTPAAGQCATTATMTIVVNANVTPTFSQLGPYCAGATSGILATTSTNGITGTWSPATISTASAGSTVYTFNPNAGQCATTATMTVVVNANVTPTFTQLGPYCVGSTPATLATTATNGITGTWSPATISTASAGSTVYTFTPTAGQCATTATMTVVVNANVTPTFSQLGPYCTGSTPGTLPLTSTNGISGTWNAAISTASAGSTVYTFTPAAGQCAATANITIVVNANATPTFSQLGPYCAGAPSGILATTSTNGITGTWSPATISTASAGSTVYTFTPTAGQCATTVTMTIVVNASVTPTFTQLGPYCAGGTPDALATSSINGITGTWLPSAISTAGAGSTVYTFTPDAAGCFLNVTMNVQINAPEIPTFSQIPVFCAGAPAPVLPSVSNNGITGTWTPATVDNLSSGTYAFTPAVGQCAADQTMNVSVEPLPVASFAPVPVSGCIPLTVNFQNNSTTGVNCMWNFGNGNISTQFNATANYNSAGLYNVTLEITSATGCRDSVTFSNAVEAYPRPTADFSYLLPEETALENEVQFTDMSSGASSWLWQFGDANNGNSVEQNPVYSYEKGGSYWVCLNVMNDYACADTICKNLTIEPFSSVYVPSAFTPFNGDNVNDLFNIQGIGIQQMHLYIFNRWGDLIYETETQDGGWDGIYKGEHAQQDVYTWVLHYRLESNLEYKMIGRVLLLD